MAEYVDKDGDLLPGWGGPKKEPKWRTCDPGCLITTDRTKGGMGSDAHTGPCIKGVPGRPGDQTPIVDVQLPEHDPWCKCRQVFCSNSGRRETLPHKPGEYDSCAVASAVRAVAHDLRCHFVHAQGSPHHRGPCITCDDPLGCLANLRGAGPGLHDPEANRWQECSQCTVEAQLRAHKRTCCDSERGHFHAALCPHYSAEQREHRAWWQEPLSPEPPQFVLDMFNESYHDAIREGWRPGGLAYDRKREAFIMNGRQGGKQAAYLAAQERLLQYYAPEQVRIYDKVTEFTAGPLNADVDRTFENETRPL